MQSFTLITLILVFFFLARQIRLLVAVATGSFPAAVIVSDTVIVGLVLFYITYSLSVRTIYGAKLDRVKLSLLAILTLAFLQSTYFASRLQGPGQLVLLQGFYSFREVFMPLSLLFLFSYLIKNEIVKNRDLIFKRLSKLFAIFLWVAIAYNFLEFTLRTALPEFNSFYNSFYLDQYLWGTTDRWAPVPVQHFEQFKAGVLNELTQLSVTRVYGIGLDLYVSGGIIFLCYLFHVFMSGKFRVLSILNCLVFVALLLSGSRGFIAPFLVLNAFIFARRYARKNFISAIFAGVVLAGMIILLVRVLAPTFDATPGRGAYFTLIKDAVDPVKENLGLLIFGNGPRYIDLLGRNLLVEKLPASLFTLVFDIGFLTLILEVGLLMLALFVLFHIIVFKANAKSDGRRQIPDQYTKGLKIIIVLSLVVTLAHLPILFDRSIIVFHVLFIALLYTWSRYRVTSHEPAPAGPTLARLGPASLG